MKGFLGFGLPGASVLLITPHLFPHVFAAESSVIFTCLPCFMFPLCPLTQYQQVTATALTFFVLKMLRSIFQPFGLIQGSIPTYERGLIARLLIMAPVWWIGIMSHHRNESRLSKRQVTVTGTEQRFPLLAPALLHGAWHGAEWRAAQARQLARTLVALLVARNPPGSPKWDAGLRAGHHHAAGPGKTQKEGFTAFPTRLGDAQESRVPSPPFPRRQHQQEVWGRGPSASRRAQVKVWYEEITYCIRLCWGKGISSVKLPPKGSTGMTGNLLAFPSPSWLALTATAYVLSWIHCTNNFTK